VPDLPDQLKQALASRYAIERELGAGGMATVYLAHDLRHDRQVALKVLRPELGQVLGPDRFLREIRTTAQLAHPHILPLHDSGEAAGFLYYVMPYVEGESLRDRLSCEKQLSLDEALRIAREVADALSYAHSHGVVHRDIKPENILLQGGHAVVADFGIAKAITAAGSERLTGTGLAIGTPAYMSPEQSAGEPDLDGRSDLYSLGCVLYEMLAGEPPFTGPSAQAILAKKLSEPLPRISVVREAVVPGLEAALNKALARTPADRFATAAAFADALAHPETVSGVVPTRRVWRRPAVRVAIAAAVLGVAAGAAALALRSRGPALDTKVVVVAPFENLIRDTSLAQLPAITTDWITQVLQNTGEFRLVPASAVAATHWAPGSRVQALAAATGAGTVITGRAWAQSDSIYLRAELVAGQNGGLLEALPTVVASRRQPLDAVRELARRAAGAAAWTAFRTHEDVRPMAAPRSYDAYRAYVDALQLSIGGEYERSARRYEEAYALDTTMLRALIRAAWQRNNMLDWGGADSLLRIAYRRRSELSKVDAVDLEIGLANILGDYARLLVAQRDLVPLVPPAVGIPAWGEMAVVANHPAEAVHAFTEGSPEYRPEEDTPDVVWYLGAAYHNLGRYEEELRFVQKARRFRPGSLSEVSAELRALAALGRGQDAFRLLDSARSMEPDPSLSPEYWGGAGPWQPYETALEFREHGYPDSFRRAIEQALQQSQLLLASDTVGPAVRLGHALVLYAAERWEEARAVYAALLATDPKNLLYLGGLGASEARLGHTVAAEAVAARLAALNPPYSYGRSPYWRARIAAVLGQKERAVALLREAVAQGIGCTAHYGEPIEDCHRDMDFESLRGYAPFDELLRPKG